MIENRDALEALARPYLFRGKRHSVRTLHTALQNAAKVRGALSAERDAMLIHRYDNSETIRFPRTFAAGGLSLVADPS